MKPILQYFKINLLLIGLLLIATEIKATNYYINNRVGNDDDNGTTKDTPWKSFKNIQERKFMPGDSILFAKGSKYNGGFIFNSSGSPGKPIVIGAYSAGSDIVINNPRSELSDLLVRYGAGRAPSFSNPDWNLLNGNVIRIEGSYVTVDGLYFHDNANPPSSNHQNKNVQKMGAVYLGLQANHNIIRNCEFSNSPVGIKVKGSYNLITRNYLHDTYDRMAHSWGPIAIMIVSPYNEVSFNRIMNYGSYGGPYGSDGGVIELDGVDDAFDGRNINIHHNISINNHGFVELAGRNVDSVTIAYNLSDDRNQFLGGGSMKNVFVYNNTIIRTREPNVDRFVFWTFVPDATFITVRNNIFVLAGDIKVFGPFKKPEGHQRTGIGNQVHDHNLYFSHGNPGSDPIGIPASGNEIVADPLFIDFRNGNYRLRSDSPARKSGAKTSFKMDLDGYPIPQNGAPDMGAYQH